MKASHFTRCIGSLLTFALLTFSCSQDTETTFAELIVEETIVPDVITPNEEQATEETPAPVIDYQKGTLVLSEDTKVALDITKGAAENSTGKKTYSLKSITQPKNGKTEMNNNNEIVYSPAADYNGDDSFSYTLNIQDSTGTAVEQVNTFTITITPTKDVINDVVTTPYETAKKISPLANDTFAASSSVSIIEISLANKGIAVLNSDNTITYTPNKGSTGEDQILYKTSITNTDGSTSIETGTVKVTIQSNVQPTGTNIKYVTTTGKSTNTGATEATAWSITHAFNTAKAGDIVYIKAGNYGAVNLVVKNSGTSSSPIQFIGYKTNPNDIESVNGPTVSYQDYKNNGDKLNATVMPLLQGNLNSDKNWTGTGIAMGNQYLKLSNIQISNYKNGVVITANNNSLKNIATVNIGDFNPLHSYPTATTNSTLNYKGIAMDLSADYLKIENSIVINAGAEGIRINNSHYQIHNNNKVYSDNNTNPTDYYYLIANGSSNNVITNAYIERVGALIHNGHGLVLKVEAVNNKFFDCQVKNTIIECSFSGVKNNYFKNCLVEGGEDNNGSIYLANGSNNNTFENCIVDKAKGICFADWNDGFNDSRDLNDAGFQNKFKNCIVKNGSVGINYYFWDKTNSIAHDNSFENCTFSNLSSLFYNNRPNSNNLFINCRIDNVDELSTTIYKGLYAVNFIYDELTTFTNINFTLP
ncbi:Ig-like domain-containing protein [Cellulophaga sp. Z1A5H]|uniref:Ig-like domain-containing protein n=1 Tax=Cellulophaga sp. Z1A5H TaxID=2687291 RepID=UPI0013FDE43E|nr:Ig-like domain-containing protein [Cellulophaga sp. Z1A5H]